jgi:hypothetical protein
MRYVRSITQRAATRFGFGKAGNKRPHAAQTSDKFAEKIGKRYATLTECIGKGGLVDRNASGTSLPHS